MKINTSRPHQKNRDEHWFMNIHIHNKGLVKQNKTKLPRMFELNISTKFELWVTLLVLRKYFF